MVELADTRLSYSHIFGSPEFLQGVAVLYQDLKPEQVIPTHGAIGANNQVITTLIGAEDNMVSVMPTYQQHYSLSLIHIFMIWTGVSSKCIWQAIFQS